MREQVIASRPVATQNRQNIEGDLVERHEPGAPVLAVRYEDGAGRDDDVLAYEVFAITIHESVVLRLVGEIDVKFLSEQDFLRRANPLMGAHIILIVVQLVGSVWIKMLSPDWRTR